MPLAVMLRKILLRRLGGTVQLGIISKVALRPGLGARSLQRLTSWGGMQKDE